VAGANSLILRHITAGYRFRLSIMSSAGSVVKTKNEGLTPIGALDRLIDRSDRLIDQSDLLIDRPDRPIDQSGRAIDQSSGAWERRIGAMHIVRVRLGRG
jgi:hypothetical protein